MQTAYIYALCANACFAVATLFFTHYTRKLSSLWMNTFKASVALVCFGAMNLYLGGFHPITTYNFLVFFISGFLALGIGDVFLLNAFKEMGTGRTLVLFGFHPVIVGVVSFIAFDQAISSKKLVVILLFILCLIIFSVENFRKTKSWDLKGILLALLGMSFDAVGVTITRYGFNLNENLTAFEGNFYRCLGAIVAYILLSYWYPFSFVAGFKKLRWRSRGLVFIGAFLGTFLSLAFYLEAIKTSHLATISAISITGVTMSAGLECLWEKKAPSIYLLGALSLLSLGLWILFDT
ncbi:MAG: EamA family transporter [Halobacteriovoraceae bacterium]|nr:EamA family transporter [Halobacteriovoraceae bacterium]|tara:strand:+ start:5792 stop:6670 length:879 start_codon:yes stop_codon:yes gene_type:complete